MTIDITGTVLTPGNCGKDCFGNGSHLLFPCCCDECDYMLCCAEYHDSQHCSSCKDTHCPNTKPIRKTNILFAFWARIFLRSSLLRAILKVPYK